jgi:hypothetical protein
MRPDAWPVDKEDGNVVNLDQFESPNDYRSHHDRDWHRGDLLCRKRCQQRIKTIKIKEMTM